MNALMLVESITQILIMESLDVKIKLNSRLH